MNSIRAFENKKSIVIKDPKHAFYIQELNELFPDSKCIFLTRDVIDVCQSKGFFETIDHGINAWRDFNSNILRYKNIFSQFITVRYEDLVDDPEVVVSKLTEFIGFNHEPEALQYWEHEHADDKMRLWGGVPPKSSRFQRKIGLNKIEKSSPKNFDARVLEKIIQVQGVSELRRKLGYSALG